MCQQGPTSEDSVILVRGAMEISNPCSVCTKGMCRGAASQLLGNLSGKLSGNICVKPWGLSADVELDHIPKLGKVYICR